jgi:hypothetical protein
MLEKLIPVNEENFILKVRTQKVQYLLSSLQFIFVVPIMGKKVLVFAGRYVF